MDGAVEDSSGKYWPNPIWQIYGYPNTPIQTRPNKQGRNKRTVRLVVRRTRLTEPAQHRLWPDWRHHANAAWLACAVLAHNLGCWTTLLSGQPPATNRTRRTRLISLAAVIVNRSGRKLLRLPARWPWATEFHAALTALRALLAPSG